MAFFKRKIKIAFNFASQTVVRKVKYNAMGHPYVKYSGDLYFFEKEEVLEKGWMVALNDYRYYYRRIQ